MTNLSVLVLSLTLLGTSIIVGYSLQHQSHAIDIKIPNHLIITLLPNDRGSAFEVNVNGIKVPSSLDVTHNPNTKSNLYPITIRGALDIINKEGRTGPKYKVAP